MDNKLRLSRFEIFTIMNCIWDCERLLRTSETHRKRLSDGPMSLEDFQQFLDKLLGNLHEAFKEADW